MEHNDQEEDNTTAIQTRYFDGKTDYVIEVIEKMVEYCKARGVPLLDNIQSNLLYNFMYKFL
jgi:thiamine monophosphate synthase